MWKVSRGAKQWNCCTKHRKVRQRSVCSLHGCFIDCESPKSRVFSQLLSFKSRNILFRRLLFSSSMIHLLVLLVLISKSTPVSNAEGPIRNSSFSLHRSASITDVVRSDYINVHYAHFNKSSVASFTFMSMIFCSSKFTVTDFMFISRLKAVSKKLVFLSFYVYKYEYVSDVGQEYPPVVWS